MGPFSQTTVYACSRYVGVKLVNRCAISFVNFCVLSQPHCLVSASIAELQAVHPPPLHCQCSYRVQLLYASYRFYNYTVRFKSSNIFITTLAHTQLESKIWCLSTSYLTHHTQQQFRSSTATSVLCQRPSYP